MEQYGDHLSILPGDVVTTLENGQKHVTRQDIVWTIDSHGVVMWGPVRVPYYYKAMATIDTSANAGQQSANHEQ